MSETKYLPFFAIVAVVMGGGLLVYYSGSAGMKDAVAHNKMCQNLKEQGSREYDNCQAALDTLMEQLLESQELDVNACKGEETRVYCPVRVWYVTKYLVITSPVIIQRVHQDNISPADAPPADSPPADARPVDARPADARPADAALGRPKRETINKNNNNSFKNKCYEGKDGEPHCCPCGHQ